MTLGAVIVSFPCRRESTGAPGSPDCRVKPDNDIGSRDSVIPVQAGIQRTVLPGYLQSCYPEEHLNQQGHREG